MRYAEQLRLMLEKHQWEFLNDSDRCPETCVECYGEAHKPDCPLAALLVEPPITQEDFDHIMSAPVGAINMLDVWREKMKDKE